MISSGWYSHNCSLFPPPAPAKVSRGITIKMILITINLKQTNKCILLIAWRDTRHPSSRASTWLDAARRWVIVPWCCGLKIDINLYPRLELVNRRFDLDLDYLPILKKSLFLGVSSAGGLRQDTRVVTETVFGMPLIIGPWNMFVCLAHRLHFWIN